MKPIFRFAMLALALVLVALVSALTAMRFAIHGQEVKVPTVVGLTPGEAERVVTGLGLQVEVERQYYSPTIPEGRIMTQMPLAGTIVRRGWQLRVAESMGPQRVSIPDVTNQSERAAALNIRRRGLEVASVAEIPLAGASPDQVLAQSPPANASQVSAPKTNLLVASSPDAPAFVMPNLTGQPLDTATRTLQDAGFKLGTVSLAPPATLTQATVSPEGLPPQAPATSAPPPQPSAASIIVTQWPPPGQKVLAGAVINFEVR